MILLGTRGSTMKQTLVTTLLWVSQDCRLHKYVAFALLHVLPSLPTGTHTNTHSATPPHHCAFMPYPCIDPLCPTWCPALGCFQASARELHGWAVGTVDEPCSGSGSPAIRAVPGKGLIHSEPHWQSGCINTHLAGLLWVFKRNSVCQAVLWLWLTYTLSQSLLLP